VLTLLRWLATGQDFLFLLQAHNTGMFLMTSERMVANNERDYSVLMLGIRLVEASLPSLKAFGAVPQSAEATILDTLVRRRCGMHRMPIPSRTHGCSTLVLALCVCGCGHDQGTAYSLFVQHGVRLPAGSTLAAAPGIDPSSPDYWAVQLPNRMVSSWMAYVATVQQDPSNFARPNVAKRYAEVQSFLRQWQKAHA